VARARRGARRCQARAGGSGQPWNRIKAHLSGPPAGVAAGLTQPGRARAWTGSSGEPPGLTIGRAPSRLERIGTAIRPALPAGHVTPLQSVAPHSCVQPAVGGAIVVRRPLAFPRRRDVLFRGPNVHRNCIDKVEVAGVTECGYLSAPVSLGVVCALTYISGNLAQRTRRIDSTSQCPKLVHQVIPRRPVSAAGLAAFIASGQIAIHEKGSRTAESCKRVGHQFDSHLVPLPPR
jgi:hypothetical protein